MSELETKEFSRFSVHSQLSMTMGEVLTLVEASFSDREQRESFKSMVKLIFQKRHNWIDELSGDDVVYDMYRDKDVERRTASTAVSNE